MHAVKKMMGYPMKKRKRSFLTALCCIMLVYAGVQFMYLNDDYSPLQLLSSVENEASRLLRFMGQLQVQCNNSVATNNASTWILCQETEFGVGPSDNEEKSLIVYSVGPSPDYNFELFVNKNLTSHMYVFSHLAEKLHFLTKTSPTTAFFKTTIVPNDPADFARNSFDTQTLNSAKTNLKHKEIDILKLDTFVDSVHSFEVLRFLIDDSFLQTVKELHIVLKLDKVEEDYIYSWYRVLYALFHKAGFRLYHTSASDPLCLQDTIMESCKYFLSWVRQPPPHVLVMYPPAIDGSIEFEEERMTNFLDDSSSRDGQLLPVEFVLTSQGGHKSSAVNLRPRRLSVALSQSAMKKSTQSCSIIFILDEKFHHFGHRASSRSTDCQTHLFAYSGTPASSATSLEFLPLTSLSSDDRTSVALSSIEHIMTSSSTNIVYIELEHPWEFVRLLSGLDIPKHIDQLIMKTPIFLTSGRPQPVQLRRKYSELKRLEEFQLLLVDFEKTSSEDLKYGAQQSIFTLNFVKKALL